MFEKVREIIMSICQLSEEEITPEATLANDLGINSFELVNLIIAFEEEFDIEIEEDEVFGFTTVSDIVEYLEGIPG